MFCLICTLNENEENLEDSIKFMNSLWFGLQSLNMN